MKEDELTALGVDEETAKKIIDMNGADIENAKRALQSAITKLEGERDGFKGELDAANVTLEKFKDIDPEKVREYDAKIAELQTKHAQELAKRDSRAETDRFLAGSKFINDITRDHYAAEIEKALDDVANKGKSRQDIFDGLTKDEKGQAKPGIFIDESPNQLLTLPPSGDRTNIDKDNQNSFMNALIRGTKGD